MSMDSEERQVNSKVGTYLWYSLWGIIACGVMYFATPIIQAVLGTESTIDSAIDIRESVRDKVLFVTIIRVVLICIVLFALWERICRRFARNNPPLEKPLIQMKVKVVSFYLLFEGLGLLNYMGL